MIRVTIFTLCFLLLSPCSAEDLIEAFGDSITAGFLAHTSLKKQPTQAELENMLKDLALFKLGDEKKYELIQKYEYRNKSWAAILRDKINSKIPVRNYATPGDRSWHLIPKMNGLPNRIENALSFIFTGHNDLCNGTIEPERLIQTFRDSYQTAVTKWTEKHENSRLYLVPLGDIPEAFSVLEKETWQLEEGQKLTCMDTWTKIFLFCPYFAFLQKSGKLKEKVAPLRDAMNAFLKEFESKKYQVNNNRIAVIQAFSKVSYLPEDFAIDCFHLSEQGQSRLALGLWDEIKNL